MPTYSATKVVTTLIQINVQTGIPTGLIKDNEIGDPDYISPVPNSPDCGVIETEWVPDETTAECETIEIWGNVQKSQNFQKQGCPTDYTGSTVTYTVPAGTHLSTVSQQDADNKALAQITANGQNYANANGVCTQTTFWNTQRSQSFTKNDCGAGFHGTSPTYTVPAHTYSGSTQMAADALAQADIDANGQSYANAVGSCLHDANYWYFNFNQTAIDATGIVGTISQKRAISVPSIQTLNSITIDSDWSTVSGFDIYTFSPTVTSRFIEVNLTANTLTDDLKITLKNISDVEIGEFTIPAGATGVFRYFEGAETNEPIINAFLELVEPEPEVYEPRWEPSGPYCVTEDIVINEFDYLVARYIWDTPGGTDLDIQVQFENTGQSAVDNIYVGYGGINPTVPASTTPETNAYLWWGLDTTSSSGVEGVLVGLKKFKDDFPSAPEVIEVGLYAVWYNTVLSGNFTLEVATYKGGTMSKVGTNIINTGGVQVSLDTRALNTTVSNHLHTPASSYKIGTLKYNKTTDTAILELA